jgi:hypothetical protein
VSCCGQLGAFSVWWSVLLSTGKQQNRGEVQSINSVLCCVVLTAFGTHFTAFNGTIYSVLSYVVLTAFGTRFTSFNQKIIVIANEISDVLP